MYPNQMNSQVTNFSSMPMIPSAMCNSVPSSSQTLFTTNGSQNGNNASWLFDSGATNHITNNLSNLHIQQPFTAQEGVAVGNGSQLPIIHSGQGVLPTASGQFFLQNLLHVPQISHNLISVRQFAKDDVVE